MVNWDKSVDLLIAGSGGGMVAALVALDSGIEPLVVEKQDLVGGATGMSGGMVWLPNNPLMVPKAYPIRMKTVCRTSTTSWVTSVRLPRRNAARCSSPPAAR